MMVSAVRVIVAGVSDAHVAQTEAAPECALDDCTVLRPDEIESRILRCGLSLRLRCAGYGREQRGQHDEPDDLHEQAPSEIFRGRERPENRVLDTERSYRSNRGSPAAHSASHSSRIRTGSHAKYSRLAATVSRPTVRRDSSCASNPRPIGRRRRPYHTVRTDLA